jgi:hypothetical protein
LKKIEKREKGKTDEKPQENPQGSPEITYAFSQRYFRIRKAKDAGTEKEEQKTDQNKQQGLVEKLPSDLEPTNLFQLFQSHKQPPLKLSQ